MKIITKNKTRNNNINVDSLVILEQRMLLFKDFSVELIKKVNSSFPGSDGIDDNDILNHYNWCFDSICDVFQKQNVYFKDNQEIRDYFLDILINSYYNIEDKQKDNATNGIIKSLFSLFSIDQTDSKLRNALNSIFKKFNQSIDK